ncbi:hypothetical protein ZIOFF_055890 [Zingiber officinale]|uniref:DDE Tnp4 domain-containing protein n=1 Tax=Zingiber officinale TaxID=94328 RepID=A0A8J5FCZ8_ZINOF|nr:hypothetical protein ZIOFF_055890 [Zingiber officinale]
MRTHRSASIRIDTDTTSIQVYVTLQEPIAADSIDWRWKWFKNCLGALDGTHIKVRVPTEDRPRYRTRKGEIATNVLAACSQDMQFTYVLSGWEGSAVDSRVNMASNPSGESYNPKRPGKNKHQWSAIEDAVLIEALMQLNNARYLRNKNEKGFRPGHGLKLQQMLEVSLPGHGIKAKNWL